MISNNTLDNKQKLGQFYTTNQNYILQNLYIPNNIDNIIEPFAGNGDLVNFINEQCKITNKLYNIECYDIEPKKDYIKLQDTLSNPPDYNNKFLITNPPYLARNKSVDKKLFDKYNVNDLYKCLIKEIIINQCLGGILIIPLNFWCSIRNMDIELRKSFLHIYNIITLNIFEETVFDDTSYSICSFQFSNKNINNIDNIINIDNIDHIDNINNINNTNNTNNYHEIKITIFPKSKKINLILNAQNNYTFGGEIYNLPNKNIYHVTRVTSKNKKLLNTNILVKCIDDNEHNKINLSIVSNDKLYIDETKNLSSRTYASLIIIPILTLDEQKILVNKFNIFLNEMREKYNSLFLTNYRESNKIARKRISFELVYQIIQYILEN